LKGDEDPRALPVFIDQLQAQSIIVVLSGEKLPRPLTHDLFVTTLRDLSCEVKRVEVHDLVDDTFYGKLVLSQGGVSREIDSRPSDAIALAVRVDAPIFVHEKVMDEAGVVVKEEATEESPGEQVEESASEPPSALEILKRKLQEAIDTERYEEAARLRDEIRKATTSN
jgi:bifunctional DNase/RNase